MLGLKRSEAATAGFIAGADEGNLRLHPVELLALVAEKIGRSDLLGELAISCSLLLDRGDLLRIDGGVVLGRLRFELADQFLLHAQPFSFADGAADQ